MAPAIAVDVLQMVAAGVCWFAGGILLGIYLTLWFLTRDEPMTEPKDLEEKDSWRPLA